MITASVMKELKQWQNDTVYTESSRAAVMVYNRYLKNCQQINEKMVA